MNTILSPRTNMILEVYFDMCIRCLFCKPWPGVEPKVTLAHGKFSAEKLDELGPYWTRVVDRKHHGLGFAKESGLITKGKKDEEDSAQASQEVDLGTLRELKANSSDANPPDPSLHQPAFNRGDEVTLRSRFTWKVHVPGRDNFRKEINEGQQGVIEGWADRHQKQVLL